MTKGIGIKQLPTVNGYQQLPLTDTVTPLAYLDAWGWIEDTPTNNVAELQAMIEAYKYLTENPVDNVLILSDSQYVKNGLQKWVKNWKRNDWIKPDGEPVANRGLWETFLEWEEKIKALGLKVKVDWVKGHSGNVGNDIVDNNAKTGSGGRQRYHLQHSDVQGYHNPKVQSNDLMLKKWLVFDMAAGTQQPDGYHYYHMFNLGGMNGYGHKKEDSLRQRHSKTATLFGRRISDATFAVMRTPTPVDDLDRIISLHQQAHQQDIVELGLACLDVVYKPTVQQRLETHGAGSLIKVDSNRSLITASDELVSITINPPYMANEGATLFGMIQKRFVDFLEGKKKKGV
jgi:ribonuclease HI